MTASMVTPAALIEAARALAPRVREARDEIEQGRRLPVSLVEAMREAGLFRVWLPRSLGGYELDPLTLIQIAEEVARVDGAAGWNLMIGAGTNFLTAFLRDDVARDLFGTDGQIISGGTLAPLGKATPVPGGHRITGRWPFGSGSSHCDWLVGNCLVMEDGKPRMRPNGAPETRLAFFPRGEYELLDTWYVGGLRGTGSQDYAVQDLFVPEERSFSLGSDPPYQAAPLYLIPQTALFPCCLAAVPLGIARGAIDALVELAGAKTPTGSQSLLRDRAAVQADVARAEALVRSARAFVFESLADAFATVEAGNEVTLQQRAIIRTAGTHATISAAQAVDLMYNAGGASSIYASSPLERAFRDVHTATQHAMVSPAIFEPAGKVFLGMDIGALRF
jgi:alkylation response protein AidB-like acyl-CoA dehydrogenase